VWTAQGEWGRALGWARERGLSVDDELSYLREYEHLTLARVLLARCAAGGADGALDEVTGLLDRLLRAAEEGARTASVIEVLLVQALAHRARGDVPAALAALRRALALAEPEGHVRLFVDEGAPLRALLRRVAGRRTAPASVRRLLAAADRAAAGAAAGAEDGTEGGTPARADLLDPLSARELDVLRMLGSDLTGPDIARHLFVSLNTVRTHTKAIYTKLGVNSRRAAISRAEELDLLSRRDAARRRDAVRDR
jgi:LuxR family maltose regulon positive regulatory protein